MPAQNNQEKLQLLLETCRLLSSQLKIEDLLNTIMDLASRVVGAETASLLLLDPETDELYFDVALGLDPEVSKIRLKMGQGIAGTVAQEGKPVIINDVASDPRWSSIVDKQSGFKTRSIIAAPMMIKDRLIGVVEALNHTDGPFSFTDLRIFEAFASQAAIAIDNARLFSSLKAEKAKLETVFARMQEGAILTDQKGGISLCNEAARRFFAIGQSAHPSLAEELGNVKVNPPVFGILSSPEPTIAFEAVREEPKKLILEGSASIMTFGSEQGREHTGRLFVFRDVTDERQEEALKRSFLSLISHKLKTPLASITGYAQLLMEDPNSGKYNSDLAVKAVQTILAQGKKLSELLDKLLRFITLEDINSTGVHRKAFKIDDAIVNAASSIKPWLDEQKAIVLVESSSGEVAFGDPVLIQDAIKNLVENAVKFNTKAEKKVAVWAEKKNDFVEVNVSDQGPGIPPEDQQKIFAGFYQVESAFTGQVEGWGLGLPFVKKVIEHHGGAIEVKSKLAEGTTISFTVPHPPAEKSKAN